MSSTGVYHYKESGLGNIYLAGGFRFVDGPDGRFVVIEDIDGLHELIGMELVEKKESLTGKEIRFLRHELEMSQALLARLLQVSEQTVHRWEAGKADIPKPAETLIRLLYRDQLEPKPKLNMKQRLEQIADMEHALDVQKMRAKRKNQEWLFEAA